MTLASIGERLRQGSVLYTELTACEAPEAKTLLQSTWRDYIYAEIWSRPGLDLRSRYFIAIAGAACEGGREDIIDNYIRGALASESISLAELREAALQLAVYGGWSKGTALDTALTRVQRDLALPDAEIEPLRSADWDPDQRLAEGGENFRNIMTFPSPPPAVAYFQGGILNFVFAEMWRRPALDQRGRRWVTLVGVSESSSHTPIHSHIYGAMKAGDASIEEMHEFVLQYAVHGGWPKASVIQGAVFAMGKLIQQGLPYEA